MGFTDISLRKSHPDTNSNARVGTFSSLLLRHLSYPNSRPRRIRRKLFEGWRLGVLISCISSFLLFMINLAIALYAARRYPVNSTLGIGTIFEGPCDMVKSIDTVLHIGINIISTGLLAASNYTTQVLVSPTRKDIDTAHAKKRYLDIGVQSLRNFAMLPWGRKLLWGLLIASSVPLHLLFNSAVFSSSSSNRYQMIAVTEEFLENYRAGVPIDETTIRSIDSTSAGYSIGSTPFLYGLQYSRLSKDRYDVEAFTSILASSKSYEMLSSRECRQEYGTELLSGKRNLVVVLGGMHEIELLKDKLGAKEYEANRPWEFEYDAFYSRMAPEDRSPDLPEISVQDAYWNFVNTTVFTISPLYGTINFQASRSYSWMCWSGWLVRAAGVGHIIPDSLRYNANCYLPGDAKYEDIEIDDLGWRFLGWQVQHCLTEIVPESCKLHFSMGILYGVIAMNIVKVLVMIGVLTFYNTNELLVTLGDAIASFLEKPDPTTRNYPLLSRRQVVAGAWPDGYTRKGFRYKLYAPKMKFETWVGRSENRMFSACATKLWLVCYILSIICAGLIGWGMYATRLSESISFLSFADTFNSRRMFRISRSPIEMACLTNSPQLLASFLYLQYNSIYTYMAQTREWLSYGAERKGLRVSFPKKRPQPKKFDGSTSTFGIDSDSLQMEEVPTAQRESHFLTLPYRYSIPLAAASALVHWLVSQACFFAQLTVVGGADVTTKGGMGAYQPGKADTEFSAAMQSPTAMLCVIIVTCLLLLVGIGFGARKLPDSRYGIEMPIVSSCSVAISAACQVGSEERSLMDSGHSTDESTGSVSPATSSDNSKYGVELHELEMPLDGQSKEELGSIPIERKQRLRISEEKVRWGLVDWKPFATDSINSTEPDSNGQRVLANCGFSSMEVGIVRKSKRLPSHVLSRLGSPEEGYLPLRTEVRRRFWPSTMLVYWEHYRVVYKATIFSKVFGYVDIGFTPDEGIRHEESLNSSEVAESKESTGPKERGLLGKFVSWITKKRK
ncbi:hypothetical protein BJ508DRAFT_181460 [Ascobolus immersus RN42]|uniref:DUF6536 domain-containing protein n=1 Tax=Ascobolus immersus RN42 TaxID=1160509 RepID=A0A3N4HS71_ASCIM|nr:hypothetical protein BJ508DRAFT_181460 [Ascobolus immersus RN42]